MNREEIMLLILDLVAEIRDLYLGVQEQDVVPQIKAILSKIEAKLPR